jgi:hypothetical protein
MRAAIIAAIIATLVAATSATAAFVVTSRNIKNGTIQMVDISAKAKRALKGNRGPVGPRGAQGPVGAQGTAGAQGPPGVQQLVEVTSTITIGPGGIDSTTAMCPPGTGIVSGGATFIAADGEIFFDRRFAGSGWSVGGDNFDSTLSGELRAHAYCSPGISWTNMTEFSPEALVAERWAAHSE